MPELTTNSSVLRVFRPPIVSPENYLFYAFGLLTLLALTIAVPLLGVALLVVAGLVFWQQYRQRALITVETEGIRWLDGRFIPRGSVKGISREVISIEPGQTAKYLRVTWDGGEVSILRFPGIEQLEADVLQQNPQAARRREWR